MLRPGFPGRALTVHGTSTGRTHFPFVHRGRAVGIALVAGVLSGLPSTAWAVLKGEDPLAAARAAGTLLPGRPDRPGLVAGALVHTGYLSGVGRVQNFGIILIPGPSSRPRGKHQERMSALSTFVK